MEFNCVLCLCIAFVIKEAVEEYFSTVRYKEMMEYNKMELKIPEPKDEDTL